MKNKLIILFFIFFSNTVFCQDFQNKEYKLITHNVEMGETIIMIARKYKMPPEIIYKLNRGALNGIDAGMKLRIPVEVQPEVMVAEVDVPVTKIVSPVESIEAMNKEVAMQEEQLVAENTEKVKSPIETIEEMNRVATTKKIKSPIETIEEMNKAAGVRNENKVAENTKSTTKIKTLIESFEDMSLEELIIMDKNSENLSKKAQQKLSEIITNKNFTEINNEEIEVEKKDADIEIVFNEISKLDNPEDYHKVQKGETLYSLSKKLNITIDEIIELNPILQEKQLQLDQYILFRKKVTSVAKKENKEIETQEVDANHSTIKHTVLQGETLYGLSVKYNISIEELKKQNPILTEKGLIVGQILTITSKK